MTGKDAGKESAGDMAAEEAGQDAPADGQPARDNVAAGEQQARDEVAELNDRLMRALAEAENVRRRSERQIQDARAYAVTEFARDLLSVSDNLRRALDAVPDGAANEELRSLIDGVEMTERELLNAFQKHGITKIVPEGEKFDHNLHQAMFEVESADTPSGTIVQVIQPGYVLRDRLLRPAMVGVTKSKPGEAPGRIQGVDETV